MLEINDFQKSFELYFEYSTRSNKSISFIQEKIGQTLLKILDNPVFCIKYEHVLPCLNFSGKKKCDIVLFKENKEIAIFPLKFIKTNFIQNRNNYLENLVGESYLLKNNNLCIIPINIICDKVPYLNKDSTIKIIETINYENSFKIYDQINLFTTSITIILNVQINDKIGEKFKNIKINDIEYFSGEKKNDMNFIKSYF